MGDRDRVLNSIYIYYDHQNVKGDMSVNSLTALCGTHHDDIRFQASKQPIIFYEILQEAMEEGLRMNG